VRFSAVSLTTLASLAVELSLENGSWPPKSRTGKKMSELPLFSQALVIGGCLITKGFA
jgi:hypothetical protein